MRSQRSLGIVCVCLVLFAASQSAFAQLPLKPGQVVATCGSTGAGGVVLALFDTRSPGPAPLFPNNWFAPEFTYPTWNVGQLGELFGIALDDAPSPNIYVTATSVYGSASSGRIFRINGSSGVASVFATLPNGTLHPGLGNIAFDKTNQQFFVTNHFDGKIYRLDAGGTVVGTFDPFAAYNPVQSVQDFVPLGERIWGLGVFGGRVYFSRWSEDGSLAGPPNSVWSVGLGSSGNFSGPEVLEVTLPPASNLPDPSYGLKSRTMPIADIAFSNDGRILLAERSMSGSRFSTAHHSRVLEFSGGHLAWGPSGRNFQIGAYTLGPNPADHANAAGGVDYVCSEDGSQFVAATGDALRLDSQAIYGIQLTPVTPTTGGDVTTSHVIDLDGEITQQDKTQIGDVEGLSHCPGNCLSLVDLEILCRTVGAQITYTLHFKVKNNSTTPASNLFLVNFPSGLTATPNSWTFSGGLAPGATSGVLTATITGGVPGMTVPFTLSLFGAGHRECCAVDETIELPDCGCAQLVSSQVVCAPGGGYVYNYTVRNLTTGPIEYVLFASNTPNLTIGQPGVPIPSVPPGGTYSGQVSFSGSGAVARHPACFTLSLHDHELNECCSINKCVRMPRCPIHLPPQ